MRSLRFVAMMLIVGCGRVAEDPPDAAADAATEEPPWDPKDHLGECCAAKAGAGPLPADAAPLCPYPKGPCRPTDYCCWDVGAWEAGVLNYGCIEYMGRINLGCLPGAPK